MYASCDRIENGIAVLAFDDGTVCNIPVERLTALVGVDISERDILKITADTSAEYGIKTAIFDPDERDRRLAAARERLRRLASKSKNL